MATKERPVSPINGQPCPEGRPFTSEQAREAGKKGGRKSGQTRRERKTLREDLLSLLSDKITDESGRDTQTQVAISVSLVKQALNGNTKAYEIIRDTIGEKPVENVNIVSCDFSALDEAFQRLAGDET